MAHIHAIEIANNQQYLIEPTLYITPNKSGTAYTASLANFSLVTGVTVQAKFTNTNDANATLNVNSTGAKEIHYNGAKITENQFKANHVYTLVYDGTQWQVSGDIDTNSNTWRGVQDNLTSDSTTDSLSAKQGKVLKGLIDAMDASTPAASGNATAFIDSITQTDGKITSITKKTIPAASTSTAGIVKIGTTANDAAAGNHNHDSTYSYIHLTDYDFTNTQPLSKYVTFDKSRPVGAPKEEWYNGFISSHSNYHASYIINGHTNQNEWYVGHGIWREANTPHATAPTWYLLAHSGNVGTGDNNGQVKIAGQNVSVKGLKALAYKDSLVASDIPDLSWSKITSDKPTTLSGYGITDATAKNHSHTLTIGNKSLSVSTSEQTWALHDILYSSPTIGKETSWDQTTPGIYYVASSGEFTGTNNPENTNTNNGIAPYHYGQLIVSRAGNAGVAEFYISHHDSDNANYGIHYRTGWNNTYVAKWSVLIDSYNYTQYTVGKDGTGASGSWGISVTGTAANVTGTVAIAHGGTGATTASAAANALISELPVWTATPTADTYFIRRDTTGAAAFGQVKFSSIANITNNTLRLGPYSSTLVTSVNGNIGDVTITAADLGLHTPLSFVGVVAVNSTYQPSDGTYGVPTIVGVQEYTPASGDVILDKDSLREYVFANDVWTLLGYTASQIYDSNNIAVGLAPEDVPTWISRVTQATDGSIQVERKTIGVLPIAHGGTGASSFSANAVIISTSPSAGETMTLTSRPYSNSIGAEALSISTNFVTEQDVYYGLPKINNLHNYTSDSDIYAPTTSGEQHQLLVSNDTGNAPVWTVAATVQSEVSTSADVAAYTTLTLGNSINVTAATAHSEGQIQLYSAATHAHIIKGTSTNTLDYTHILPNSDGVLVQTSSAGAVGGPTQPVYVNADNTITALTFTQNRLYYSASDSSFAATNHYASATQIGLGTITLPQNNTDTLYVNGTTYFAGNVKHNGFAYFANGTTYYIDDTGDAHLKNLGIGDAAVSASYALNIEGDTYINGTHFFGNGTTYFIDDDAIGFFPDLRADQIRLNGDQISFYQTENAAGDLYGSIQGIKDYMHFVLSNGTVDTTPTFDFNGHLLPSSDEIGDLGSSTNRWAHLYLGTDDTYGDSYTPVYWNDGVPATVVPVQYCKFTIKESKGVMLTHEAFKENSYVLQIVVTSGESNLNSPIRWASYSSGQLALFCLTPPSGDVSGYILVSRGDSITPESEDFTGIPRPPVDPPTPPPVDPPSPPTPEPEGE